MFRAEKTNIVNVKADALVNSVNLVGVMGKGVALAIKEAFPENYKLYKKACQNKQIDIGKIFVTETGQLFPRYIINFPTKKHWRNPSHYSWIEEGLISLKEWLANNKINSIAIPPLGSGSGKLDWNKVKCMIMDILGSESEKIDIILIEPDEKFETTESFKEQNNKLTPTRAMLLYLLNKYRVLGNEINLLVIQKIAYFLQRNGEPLKLNFQKGYYGPYAYNLIPVLKALKPKYLSFKTLNDSKPSTIIRLNQDYMGEVEKYVGKKLTPQQKENLEKTLKLIQDFETPFGLELLGTIDFIFVEQKIPSDTQTVLKEITKWTHRKAKLFNAHHIEVAHKRLLDHFNYY